MLGDVFLSHPSSQDCAALSAILLKLFHMMEEVFFAVSFGIQSEAEEPTGSPSAPAASPFFSLLKSSHSTEDQLSCPLVSLNVLPEDPGVAWGPPLLLRKHRGVGNDRALAWGCSWPEGREQEKESRIKRAAPKPLKELQRGAPRGLWGRVQVMHSQAFALGWARVL